MGSDYHRLLLHLHVPLILLHNSTRSGANLRRVWYHFQCCAGNDCQHISPCLWYAFSLHCYLPMLPPTTRLSHRPTFLRSPLRNLRSLYSSPARKCLVLRLESCLRLRPEHRTTYRLSVPRRVGRISAPRHRWRSSWGYLVA